MKRLKEFFVTNIKQKVASLLIAGGLWALINHSITDIKQVKVAIRPMNLPPGKTIRGLMPDGVLQHHHTLKLYGRKGLLEKLQPTDIEVHVDARHAPQGACWVVQVEPQHLVSINADIDLTDGIMEIKHVPLVLQWSNLLTAQVSVMYVQPDGEPPDGYQFLDIFPQKITHTVTGPEEDVKALQASGVEVVLDLRMLSKQQLDAIPGSSKFQADEVDYPMPTAWKMVSIPFLGGMQQELNGPAASELRVTFLRKGLHPLDRALPLRIFYPPATSTACNPASCPLKASPVIAHVNNVPVLNQKLYVGEVSRLFLDLVRDRMEVVIVPPAQLVPGGMLPWSLQIVAAHELEEVYVKRLLFPGAQPNSSRVVERERLLKHRFRTYLRKARLFAAKDQLFILNARLDADGIAIMP